MHNVQKHIIVLVYHRHKQTNKFRGRPLNVGRGDSKYSYMLFYSNFETEFELLVRCSQTGICESATVSVAV
jgi:hypothetical protein